MKQMELSSVLAQVLIAIVVFGAMSVPLVAQPALAAKPQAVTCGDTITQSLNLVADIGPCPEAGIIIGADNITLNCNGHTVRGSGTSAGISTVGFEIIAIGVTIKNCQVTEFSDGFVIVGSHQTVQDNRATDNSRAGFEFSGLGDSNLQGNTATDNELFGFISDGSQNNKIQGNTATDNGAGFALSRSFGNKLNDNTAATNNGVGFGLAEANRHSLSGNKADNNVGDGFSIGGSDGSFGTNLRSNIATNNGGDGFIIEAGSIKNSLIENKADNNVGFGYNEVASGGAFPVQNTYTNNSCNGNGAGGSNPSGLCKPQS